MNRGCPHPTLSRTRERGKAAKQSDGGGGASTVREARPRRTALALTLPSPASGRGKKLRINPTAAAGRALCGRQGRGEPRLPSPFPLPHAGEGKSCVSVR